MLLLYDGSAANDRLPPFSLQSLEGKRFESGAQLSGKVAVISIWRLGQEYSLKILRDLAGIHADFADREVEVVSIVCGEAERERVAEVVERLQLGFPVLLDPERSVYAALDVIVCPSSRFIDKEGKRRFDYAGYRRDFPRVARANIEFLLGEISEEERAERVKPGKILRSDGATGGGARYRLASRLLREGKREAAKRQLMQVWEDQPRHVAAGIDLGLLLLGDGEYEEALAVLEETRRLAGGDRRALGAHGVALIRVGRTDEGAALLERALTDEVAEPRFYYEMALLREKQKAWEDACRYYRKGFELMLARE